MYRSVYCTIEWADKHTRWQVDMCTHGRTTEEEKGDRVGETGREVGEQIKGNMKGENIESEKEGDG